MTNAEAWFSVALCPQKPEGSLGQTAQDGQFDSHTAPGLWLCMLNWTAFIHLIYLCMLNWTALFIEFTCACWTELLYSLNLPVHAELNCFIIEFTCAFCWGLPAGKGQTPTSLPPIPLPPGNKETETPPTSRHKPGGLDQPVILGIVLGIMLLLLVVFIAMCWWKQRQQKRRSE